MNRLQQLQEEQDKMEKHAKQVLEGKTPQEQQIDPAFKKQADQFTQFLEAINKNLKGIVGANGSAALHQPVLKPQWGKDGKRIPPPMAPLPVHLLPKVLGGEGGENYKIGDEVAHKKQ